LSSFLRYLDAMPRKLLNGKLQGVSAPEHAVFVEEDRVIHLFSTEMMGQVDDEFRADPGRGFLKGRLGEVRFFFSGEWLNPKECEVPDGAIPFTRKKDHWVGSIGTHTIRINQNCDDRDASHWLMEYKRLFSRKDRRELLSKLVGLELVIGDLASHKHPTAIAGAGKRTIWFFNHPHTNRLFSFGVETITQRATSPWAVATTTEQLFLHECCHIWGAAMKEPVQVLSSYIERAVEEGPGGEGCAQITNLARNINADYLISMFSRLLVHPAVPTAGNPLAPPPLANKNGETPRTFREECDYTANEFVAEAYSRYYLLGKKPADVGKGTIFANFLEVLDQVILEPLDLRPPSVAKTGQDNMTHPHLAPVLLSGTILSSNRGGRGGI